MNNKDTKVSSSNIQKGNPTATGSSTPLDLSNESAIYFKGLTDVLDDRLKEVEIKSSTTEDRLKRAEDSINDSKNRNIESLGLFVALFTFISIEFSLFKQITIISQAISLTLIIGGLLTFFVLLLHFIVQAVNNKAASVVLWVLLIVITLILTISGLFFSVSPLGKSLDKPIVQTNSSAGLKLPLNVQIGQ